ncbi:WhiB family transcriptional regulator [Nocardia cyriacigeorgica]|uniref:WhiB family transcriptional regulator n=1 Tax=Nocardia cyriacigeorgica TaxID=135487 RepID=A0A6P1DBV9_9NOCA|nr:WhiB family transcriptional regulator [Nocardia cyriacigeorgica]NEW42524.1 WhiB family transcriptional regulator [Nocardia cyriacigeorgica]NEW47977.1 WhiB family transcriptional regulator [Nocardia cyriacigeorgica]
MSSRKKMVWQDDAPETWEDRPCTNLPLEIFFPDRLNPAKVAMARGVCAACPVLARCAQWAVSAELTDCVVAGVAMPSFRTSRARAEAELRQIAAAGYLPATTHAAEVAA